MTDNWETFLQNVSLSLEMTNENAYETHKQLDKQLDKQLTHKQDVISIFDETIVEIQTIQHKSQQLNTEPESYAEHQLYIEKNPTEYKSCPVCMGVMLISTNVFVCQSCGVEELGLSRATEEFSTSANTECNVNENGFMAFKMTGPNSHRNQRSLLKSCANYSKYRKSNILKYMTNCNAQNEEYHIPKNIIQEANDMFDQIKQHGYVYRKDGKKGVLSACIYYRCYANGISKTPTEIARFSGIEEKFHSLGDRILHSLNEAGIISIPVRLNPIADYIHRYLEILNIDKKYSTFCIDLVARAKAKHIHILHDCKHNTKCIGAIYMLITRIKELRSRISKEKIEKECSVSKTTFIRYYLILHKYNKKIKKVFKHHKIPMPLEWKDKQIVKK